MKNRLKKYLSKLYKIRKKFGDCPKKERELDYEVRLNSIKFVEDKKR